MARRLSRDTGNAILGGVASGFAEYFDLDPTLVRIGFIILGLLQGIGVVAYLVCWVLMPRKDQVPVQAGPPQDPEGDQGTAGEARADGMPPADKFAADVREAGERAVASIRTSAEGPGRGRIVGGTILIGLGLLFLMERLFHVYWYLWPSWFSPFKLWPLIVIGVGAALIIGSMRRTGS